LFCREACVVNQAHQSTWHASGLWQFGQADLWKYPVKSPPVLRSVARVFRLLLCTTCTNEFSRLRDQRKHNVTDILIVFERGRLARNNMPRNLVNSPFD
jgi:hypothetical protein